ncbi:FadR/GntR family transcriptional regulator [Bradyrhizobium sp. 199]|uniref:FadR/GntR family transcriptional regulator n=1 Tax=Bradyrhizobium sp. 199 TaxID=2782664 RepID=UPI001FF826CD|nr:FadR/GntR family transcriptional regulator [Bradyrhizobium sp. 199]MCK1357575.1 FadR family transcriptional regulator [Bradyrhizobium sp. 199]
MKAPRPAKARSTAARAFQPLKAGRKSDQVFEQISAFIRAGRFPPGSRLPPERELTAMLNTSRQTVREAIYRAELIGLIETRHGAGSFVVSRNARPIEDNSLIDLIRTEVGRIGEFFELRRVLEGWCAQHAAKVGKRADFAALKARLDVMRKLEVTDPAWEENDIEFHRALAAATGNPLAVQMMEILRETFSAFYRLKQFIPKREEHGLIWQHHRDVYDALRARAPERARAAIIAHMDFVEERLAESVDSLVDPKR